MKYYAQRSPFHKMIPIVTTRFTNDTLDENIRYRTTQNHAGCVYGSPQPLTAKIEPRQLLYVIEMNNSVNKVNGVWLIRNQFVTTQHLSVYNTGNFNRYVFVGKYRLERHDLPQHLLEMLDEILFKGKTHMKRGAGFTSIPDRLLRTERWSDVDLSGEITKLFTDKYANYQSAPDTI